MLCSLSIQVVRAHGQVDRMLGLVRSGIQFSVLAMCKSVRQTWYSTLGILPSCNGFQVHTSKFGSIVTGCIGAHLVREKVKSVEHVMTWSLGPQQLPTSGSLALKVTTQNGNE